MQSDTKKQSFKYDLKERTRVFAKKIILLTRSLKIDAVNQRLISQVVASSGSIGANYCEAIESESKKDFIHKISIAKKESKETEHWVNLLQTAHPEKEKELNEIAKECRELILIFLKIVFSSKKNLIEN